MRMELSTAQQQQLALLKDIDLPQAIAWWPLAPLWWVLIASFVVAAIAAVCYLRRARRSIRYLARAELHLLARNHQLNTQQLAVQLSILFHRIAIAQRRVSTGQLSGERWEAYLTQANVPMPEAVAQFIVAAPYSQDINPGIQRAQLLDSAKRWIGGNVR